MRFAGLNPLQGWLAHAALVLVSTAVIILIGKPLLGF